jgi:DNA-directed RNA polymerase subunit F
VTHDTFILPLWEFILLAIGLAAAHLLTLVAVLRWAKANEDKSREALVKRVLPDVAKVVVDLVDDAVKERSREIISMFDRALEHARSFDSLVDTLRRERKTDRTLLEDEVLPRLAKLEERSIDHETRLGLVEKRPAWPNVP